MTSIKSDTPAGMLSYRGYVVEDPDATVAMLEGEISDLECAEACLKASYQSPQMAKRGALTALRCAQQVQTGRLVNRQIRAWSYALAGIAVGLLSNIALREAEAAEKESRRYSDESKMASHESTGNGAAKAARAALAGSETAKERSKTDLESAGRFFRYACEFAANRTLSNQVIGALTALEWQLKDTHQVSQQALSVPRVIAMGDFFGRIGKHQGAIECYQSVLAQLSQQSGLQLVQAKMAACKQSLCRPQPVYQVPVHTLDAATSRKVPSTEATQLIVSTDTMASAPLASGPLQVAIEPSQSLAAPMQMASSQMAAKPAVPHRTGQAGRGRGLSRHGQPAKAQSGPALDRRVGPSSRVPLPASAYPSASS